MIAPICPTICTPGGGGAGGAGIYSATKISNAAPFTPPGGGGFVDFDTIDFDIGPALEPDLTSDAINVLEDGVYMILATQFWSAGGSDDFISIFVNGASVQVDAAENPGVRAGSVSVLIELSAGDLVQLVAQSSNPGGDPLLASLAVEKRN